MSKLSFLIARAYENEYDFNLKKQYSEPKLEDFGGNLDQRWYVYFSFRNPTTGKLVRQTPIYTGLNQHKKKVDRYAAASILIQTITQILEDKLYNPFSDLGDFPIDVARILTVAEAVEFVLTLKKNEHGGGFADFKSRLGMFRDWLLENGYRDRHITSVNKQAIINYLNYVQLKNSARNRNNSRIAISGFYSTLVANSIVPANLAESINVLTAKPERHKSFTPKQEKDIMAHLATVDRGQLIILYIKFVSWGLFRPIEANRLRVGDIDISENTAMVQAKNAKVKIKRLPSVLVEELPKLGDPKNFLFGKRGLCEPWEANDESRGDYYSDLFRVHVKDHFGFGKDYGYYSFRHTYMAKIFKGLLKVHSYYEAESRMMMISGHTTQKALRLYLRDIDAELPPDYSHLLQ